MRLTPGLLVLAVLVIPQSLGAQTVLTEAPAVPWESGSHTAPHVQRAPTRGKAATRPNIRLAADLLNFSDKPANKTAFRPASAPKRAPIRLWRTLVVMQHSAAVFDAWSTREAIQNAGAHELNPFFRPFSGSNAIYAATQIGSGLFDYLGYRMMKSKRQWMRKFWWIPQLAGTAGALFSGVHNLGLAPGMPRNTAR